MGRLNLSWYFSDSNVGYSWLLNLSSIRLNEQELSAKKTVDLGTEVNGYFATTVPVVFYNFGDRDRGQYLRLGVGLGVGVARFNGDVRRVADHPRREVWQGIRPRYA